MKSRIFKGWDLVRRIWLLMGIAIAVGSIVSDKLLLLLPALYFILGAVLNVGCFADSCATNFEIPKEIPINKKASEETHSEEKAH